MSMNPEARAKMVKARSELVLDHPFFAHLALRLDMREDNTCGTAWTDGRVLAYNPAYMASLPLAKIKGIQCHEVLHLACCHHTRRKGRDKKLWNTACDYAINHVLLDAGLELPDGYLDDPQHHGKSADSIYARLLDNDQEIKGGADSGPQQEVEAAEDGQGGKSDAPPQENVDKVSSSESTGEDADEGRDDAAGGIGDDSGALSTPSEDPGMTGEVRDADFSDGDSSSDLELEEDNWRVATSQALQKSRESGDLPGALERLLCSMLAPALSWRELLRRFLENAARNDFTWMRPNRRHLHTGLYLPGLENQELAEIAIAVDVSGSITQNELDSFGRELSAVLEEFDTSLTVFTCDAALTARERLCRWDLPLDFAITGGGGTDFRPPFSQLERDGNAPACLIYFTDLESSHFPEEPGYPVMWVTPNKGHTPPPFGEVVIME